MVKIHTTKRAIKIGKSLGVIIDKSIANSLKIKPGDLVEVDFKTLKRRSKR